MIVGTCVSFCPVYWRHLRDSSQFTVEGVRARRRSNRWTTCATSKTAPYHDLVLELLHVPTTGMHLKGWGRIPELAWHLFGKLCGGWMQLNELCIWQSRSMLRVSKCVSFMCWRREVFKFRETSVDMMDRYSVLCTPFTCACSTFKFDLSGSGSITEMQSLSCRNLT